MTIVFIEGFDKYGSLFGQGGSNTLLLAMNAGEWNSVTGETYITSPLSSSGYALAIASNGTAQWSKTLAGNYATAIGGVRFKCGLGNTTQDLLYFQDGTTVQARIGLNSTGTFYVKAGNTVVATSTASIVANTVHYLEWSIGISATGTYSIYLDGALIMTGTGNFKQSSDAYYNVFNLAYTAGSGIFVNPSIIYDDLYLDDGTGSVLGTNPVVETHVASSDNTTAFTNSASLFGAWQSGSINTNAPGANTLFLRRFVAPAGGCTLQSVSCFPSATSGTANFKAVLYNDSSGSLGSLVATGTQVTGTTASTVLTAPFSSGQSLTASTAYWIGFITDTSVTLNLSDDTNLGYSATNTYTSGAPASPTLTSGKSSWLMFGNITGMSTHTYTVSQQPPPGYLGGDYSYVSSTTVGAEDLYNMAALNETPANIYTTSVKGFLRLATAGSRTVTMRTKSSTTDSGGTLSAVNPSTSYQWYASYWATDPNTSTAWTASGLNSALAGYEINT